MILKDVKNEFAAQMQMKETKTKTIFMTETIMKLVECYNN